jgi:hypothetical protein
MRLTYKVMAVGFASLATFATPSLAAHSGVASPTTIAVISIDTSEHSSDVSPKGTSVGDVYSGTTRLVNERAQFGKPKGASVGTARNSLRVISARPVRFYGEIFTRLPGGTVHAKGVLSTPASPNDTPHIRVIGGSGVYAGVTGRVSFYDLPGRPAHKKVDLYRLTT